MKLFISYSRDDKLYVYELADRLRDDGNHHIWIDKNGLVGGDSWWDTILNGIEQCECVVVVLSPRALGSIYCDAELRYAQALGKPILPLMLKTVDMPAHLSMTQAENIAEMSLDSALIRCIRALGTIELRIFQGKFPEKSAQRKDYPVPVLKAGHDSEHVFEVYATAVEVLETDITLAKKLLGQVIQADPDGLGLQAKERLEEIAFEEDRNKAYQAIGRLANKPALRRDAIRAWKAFTAKYGSEYDPDGYATPLADAPPIPVILQTTDVLPTPRGHHPGERWIDPKGVPMVYVPAGEFLMGSTEEQVEETFAQAKKEDDSAKKEWFTDQLPQHRQTITQPFWLDLTPVTNAAYTQFVDDGGYHNPAFWTESGWKWRQENNKTAPKDYRNFLDPQHPRISVTWFEAYAYCQWRGGRLPTEAEWEWAARGSENWIYPWGNKFVADHTIYRANSSEKTAAVGDGIRVKGASWVGALDMAGNVWEWCNSIYQPYPYQLEDRESIIIDNNLRILRGGAWNYYSTFLRAALRGWSDPNDEIINVGFRCAHSVE